MTTESTESREVPYQNKLVYQLLKKSKTSARIYHLFKLKGGILRYCPLCLTNKLSKLNKEVPHQNNPAKSN